MLRLMTIDQPDLTQTVGEVLLPFIRSSSLSEKEKADAVEYPQKVLDHIRLLVNEPPRLSRVAPHPRHRSAGRPTVVRRRIPGLVAAITPDVGGRVDQPGRIRRGVARDDFGRRPLNCLRSCMIFPGWRAA